MNDISLSSPVRAGDDYDNRKVRRAQCKLRLNQLRSKFGEIGIELVFGDRVADFRRFERSRLLWRYSDPYTLVKGGIVSGTLPPLVPANQMRGYIRVRSSGRPLVACGLFGDQDLGFVSAIPAQPIQP